MMKSPVAIFFESADVENEDEDDHEHDDGDGVDIDERSDVACALKYYDMVCDAGRGDDAAAAGNCARHPKD